MSNTILHAPAEREAVRALASFNTGARRTNLLAICRVPQRSLWPPPDASTNNGQEELGHVNLFEYAHEEVSNAIAEGWKLQLSKIR